jgi:hypothetical protein
MIHLESGEINFSGISGHQNEPARRTKGAAKVSFT